MLQNIINEMRLIRNMRAGAWLWADRKDSETTEERGGMREKGGGGGGRERKKKTQLRGCSVTTRGTKTTFCILSSETSKE